MAAIGAVEPRTSGPIGPNIGRAVANVVVFGLVGALVLLAMAGATGRFRLVPAPSHTAGTKFASSDLVFVAPVPVQRLRVGDVIIVRNAHEHALLRIQQIVDSEGPQVHFASDPPGRVRRLGGTAWRVRGGIPDVGFIMQLLAGPIQGVALVVLGFGLVVRAERRRARPQKDG